MFITFDNCFQISLENSDSSAGYSSEMTMRKLILFFQSRSWNSELINMPSCRYVCWSQHYDYKKKQWWCLDFINSNHHCMTAKYSGREKWPSRVGWSKCAIYTFNHITVTVYRALWVPTEFQYDASSGKAVALEHHHKAVAEHTSSWCVRLEL